MRINIDAFVCEPEKCLSWKKNEERWEKNLNLTFNSATCRMEFFSMDLAREKGMRMEYLFPRAEHQCTLHYISYNLFNHTLNTVCLDSDLRNFGTFPTGLAFPGPSIKVVLCTG